MPDHIYRALVLSVVKHDYLPNAVAAHPRFQLVAVADDADRPQWTHDRNQIFADQHNIPYHRDVETALAREPPRRAPIAQRAICSITGRAP